MGGKVKDLVADLLTLDQNADICVADSEGWGMYNHQKLKKIKRTDGFKGYLIQGLMTSECGEVDSEHLKRHLEV